MATILIIDDHALTRKVLNRRLAREGFNILEAENGADGVQLLRTKDVDLVLLDFMMKVMNGIETYEKIKFFKPEVPCVMMTAYAHSALVKQFMEEGGADFLVKPIREDFEHRIKDILEKFGSNLN
ncbi:MAG: response regulator [Nitrospinae bacterium]|nr:response regulator [Nitrospinota bacterium]